MITIYDITTQPYYKFRCENVLCFLSGVLGNLTTSIGPTTTLSNGTLVAFRGSNVSFNCSASSGLPQKLVWAFKGATASNKSLVSTSGSSLDFRINAIEPSHQGVYSCRALDTVTQQAVNESTQLLVYCEYQEFV